MVVLRMPPRGPAPHTHTVLPLSPDTKAAVALVSVGEPDVIAPSMTVRAAVRAAFVSIRQFEPDLSWTVAPAASSLVSA